jgi:hypothetical protein
MRMMMITAKMSLFNHGRCKMDWKERMKEKATAHMDYQAVVLKAAGVENARVAELCDWYYSIFVHAYAHAIEDVKEGMKDEGFIVA